MLDSRLRGKDVYAGMTPALDSRLRGKDDVMAGGRDDEILVVAFRDRELTNGVPLAAI